jgi:hypothetical protein
MKPKPRIYWTYYPKSKRGFWRVSHMPNPKVSARSKPFVLWRKAHDICGQMNLAIDKRFAYQREYMRELQLRKTT